MAKKIEGYLKLNIPAGGANPSPPVGPALGQRGVNIMEFCKAFNAATESLEKNMPVPVVLTIYQDKSFTFTTKTAPVSYFLKKGSRFVQRGPGARAFCCWQGDHLAGKGNRRTENERP